MANSTVRALRDLSRSFGPARAREKLQLLQRLEKTPRLGALDLRTLHDTLSFVLAYPDDAPVLRSARALADGLRHRPGVDARSLEDKGFPGSANTYTYSYAVLQQMVRRRPEAFEIDWNRLEDEEPLIDALLLFLTPGEIQGLEDIRVPFLDWIERCRPERCATDLAFVLELFAGSGLAPREQAQLFDLCELPIVYELDEPGTGRCEIRLGTGRVHYQKAELDRTRFPLAPRIRRPLPPRAVRPGKPDVVDLSLDVLCARNLEIFPLFYANPGDVTRVDCGRGLAVALVGVLPEQRSALESLYFFLVTQNGAPIAYGPAAALMGCCELGINLFPEFRGGDVRTIYAEFLRVLCHLLGVRHFYMTSYGMGWGNEEAIRSGAFWFYRKLGFVASNPEVEALARAEEKRMRAEPGYRSDRTTLRKLSHTEASLDLSDGRHSPLDLGSIGIAQTRFVNEAFAGDRDLAARRCSARLARPLGLEGRHPENLRRALASLAPLLELCGARRWSARDRKRMGRIVRAKGARSEMLAAQLLAEHETFEEALRHVAGD